MIESKMPKDIRAYKTNLIGPFNGRQLICVGIMLIVDFLLFQLVILPLELPVEYIIYALIFIDLPIAAFGWVEINGMSLETYIKEVGLKMLLAPAKRKAKHIIYEKKQDIPDKKQKKKKVKNEPKSYI